MISEIQIENFKSISKLSLKPGNVTVLIGENGSGKSNILEAITFAAAASADKLDDEFLHNRNIRVTEKDWMTSAYKPEAFSGNNSHVARNGINLKVTGEKAEESLDLVVSRVKSSGDSLGEDWLVGYGANKKSVDDLKKTFEYQKFVEVLDRGKDVLNIPSDDTLEEIAMTEILKRKFNSTSIKLALLDFLIYAPENSVLRRFEEEGAIKPLGPKGEGLLKLLETMSITSNGEFAAELKLHLNLLGWFGDLQLPTEADEKKGRLRIRDRWLSEDAPFFDQRSANEGFLYLLFYFTLMLSPRTPRFFAIDNIDNALNPKLCAELMRQIAVLAAEKGKQVICTTHNPAILDGLNLHNDRQRLYVVRRDSEGHTVANRVQAPRPRPDGASVPLSTAFMSGLLGGLPDHF